ncbi:caveolin-2 [Denticeps clupeoides]|uniref:Caveolin n=1 Tax=Denticeps clupeoides TaxID=299321 RepID=A0AAY4E478_9TELE|nr:caveolin-2-like [Denticeps clupeoides]
MMRGVGREHLNVDPEDPEEQENQEQAWKTPLETVLEEEEEEEEEEEDEDVISTQSDTRPLINERDPRQINECLKVSFEDVIAEPGSVRSGDRIWIWSHALFEVSRLWFYRVITVLLAVPVSLVAGILFGIFSCFHIWFFTPCVKITLLNLGWVQTLWSSVLDTLLQPFIQSASRCCSFISVRLRSE